MVVGLGNPGARYRFTRHNAGALTVDLLARRLDVRLTPGHRSIVGSGRLGDHRAVLAVPQTYMNDSGAAVGAVLRYFHADPVTQLVVVHDELDLVLGRVQLKYGGGLAGHNGLRSIVAHIGTRDFWRVRIGIGRPAGRQAVVDWVLTEVRGPERTSFDVGVERGADAVVDLVSLGPERAMTTYNARGVDRSA
nr:aminoacyl-tRNA hydrolase [Acidimicrobium ferrooxidans]